MAQREPSTFEVAMATWKVFFVVVFVVVWLTVCGVVIWAVGGTRGLADVGVPLAIVFVGAPVYLARRRR